MRVEARRQADACPLSPDQLHRWRGRQALGCTRGQWTAAGPGPRFCLFVHHDDAAREWAYDRESFVGRLARGLDEAKARGWTVVSIRDDWKRVFAFDQ